MNKLTVVFLVLINLIVRNVTAQVAADSTAIKVTLNWKNEPLQLGKNYTSSTDTLQINIVKFYISNVEIHYEDHTICKETNHHNLIDFEKENFIPIPRSNKIIAKLIFSIGIDSTTNVSGALSDDLDVTNGMYWAWQSGFINMKIEGSSSSCNTRKNVFQFHIGGYLKPNYALRQISLYPNKEVFQLRADLSKLFETIDLSELNSVMIPGKKAMEIADSTTKLFSIE